VLGRVLDGTGEGVDTYDPDHLGSRGVIGVDRSLLQQDDNHQGVPGEGCRRIRRR